MTDFETHPIGTAARIQQLEEEVVSAWKQGYIEAQHNAARGVALDAQEAFKALLEGQGP